MLDARPQRSAAPWMAPHAGDIWPGWAIPRGGGLRKPAKVRHASVVTIGRFLGMQTGVLLLVLAACSGDGTTTDGGPEATGTHAPTGVGTGPSASPSSSPQPLPPEVGHLFLAAVESAPEDPMAGGQFVLLVNGGREPLDVRCWALSAKRTKVSYHLLADEPIAPGAALRAFVEDRPLSADDRFDLVDPNGRSVDHTPRLVDPAGDDQFWWRAEDGKWAFGRPPALPGDLSDGRLVVSSETC